jgi:hypothetical protein
MSWQPIIAGVIVLAAAVWLCRRIYRIVASGSRDGEGYVNSCGTCSKNPQAASTSPLIQLDAKPVQHDAEDPKSPSN